MPRYFFHTRTRDRLIWDASGLDLPEVTCRDDPELTLALWSEAFDKHFRVSRALVITDAAGKVVFVAGF
jgi:hypothetical protein